MLSPPSFLVLLPLVGVALASTEPPGADAKGGERGKKKKKKECQIRIRRESGET
jgi:hypothetical protein